MQKLFILKGVFIISAFSATTACSSPIETAFASPMESLQISGYELIWHDEFNIDGAPDAKKWKYETGFIRNEELQWYQAANAKCKDGHLIIEGKKERVPNTKYDAKSPNWILNREYAEYTSASLTTQNVIGFDQARIEVSAKIQAHSGSWPAFWLMGTQRNWPECGEIDVMELITGRVLGNFYWGTTPERRNSKIFLLTDLQAKNPHWLEIFHKWIFERDGEMMYIYVDGELLNSQSVEVTNPDGSFPFKQERYMILNLAIGGIGGDPANSPFPIKLEVDFVRVYQKK